VGTRNMSQARGTKVHRLNSTEKKFGVTPWTLRPVFLTWGFLCGLRPSILQLQRLLKKCRQD